MFFGRFLDDLDQALGYGAVESVVLLELFDVVIRLRLPAEDFVEFQENAGITARVAERVLLVAFLVLIRVGFLDFGPQRCDFEEADFVLFLRLGARVEIAVDDVRASFRFLVRCS